MRAGSQMPKQVSPTQNSKRPFSSGRRPERVDVERPRALRVGRGYADEVQLGDHPFLLREVAALRHTIECPLVSNRMDRLLSTRLRAAALMPAAVLTVHQLRYLLAFGGGSGAELEKEGHQYLSALAAPIAMSVAIVVGLFFARLASAWREGAVRRLGLRPGSTAARVRTRRPRARDLAVARLRPLGADDRRHAARSLLVPGAARGDALERPPGRFRRRLRRRWLVGGAPLARLWTRHLRGAARGACRDPLGRRARPRRQGFPRAPDARPATPSPRPAAARAARGRRGRSRAAPRGPDPLAPSTLRASATPWCGRSTPGDPGAPTATQGEPMRSATRALLVAALALVSALAPAPAQALAHGGNPNFRSEIDSVAPPLPSGVSIEVLDYDSYFQLLDQHGHEVVIYGYNDEPYARIEKDGTVQVNKKSPATYLNDSRFETDVEVPKSANPEAPPEWKTVDDSGTFIWHDHRMHWMIANQLPTQVKDKSQRTKIFDYEIPMAVDGQKSATSTGRSGGSAAPVPRSCPS